MTNQTDSVKWMTIGEAGLTVILAATVFLSIIAAAKAEDAAYAFHVTLAGFASLASVFVILNRYFERGALPPQEIDGRPNYNFGPIKFARCCLGILGHRRLHGGSADRHAVGVAGP